MSQQIAGKFIRLFRIIIGTFLLLPFLSSSPILAGSLSSSPNITELDMLPGTTAKIVLSVENQADTSSTFYFMPAQPTNLKEGYASLPDFSWLNLNTGDIELASGERYWAAIVLSIPDDKTLKGQKWQANIDVTCRNQPLLSSNYILLVSVGEASPQGINWGMIVLIATVSAIGVAIWNRWEEKQRAEWPTGLKTKHWVAWKAR